MLASQQFCVKWNSYSTNLQNVFPRLLTSEHFVDITLACEGQMIKCHKVVLSACSTYFEKLLVQNPCQHPIIFMKDMKHWEVQALVDFMYKGEVNVSQDELSSLLVAAEALQIRGLCGSDHMGRGTALPQDTVLSGSGRESPASKRKRVEDSPQTSSRHSCQTTSSSKLCNSDSDIVTSLEQTQEENCEITESEMLERKPIKQEVDIDENFGDDGLENDRTEEHYANHEAQDDSDSKEQPQSPRDQPGPSGLPPNQTLTADKAATGWMDDNGVCHELCKREGLSRFVRRRCRGCYHRLRKVSSRRQAENASKKVVTFCSGCLCMPAMCSSCFYYFHSHRFNYWKQTRFVVKSNR